MKLKTEINYRLKFENMPMPIRSISQPDNDLKIKVEPKEELRSLLAEDIFKLPDGYGFTEGGSVVPSAITYRKNPDGSYTLEKYEQTRDGSEFGPSIIDFCVMPVSGNKISWLSDKILTHYSDYQDIIKLERQNLVDHLKRNHQYGVFLYQKDYQKPVELIPIT